MHVILWMLHLYLKPKWEKYGIKIVKSVSYGFVRLKKNGPVSQMSVHVQGTIGLFTTANSRPRAFESYFNLVPRTVKVHLPSTRSETELSFSRLSESGQTGKRAIFTLG